MKLSPDHEYESAKSLSAFLDGIGQGNLLLVLDGPNGSRGAFVLKPGLLQSIIEMITLGQLSGLAPIERRMTRTDAAIVEPFVNAVLQRLLQANLPDKISKTVKGFSFGAIAPDLHNLGNLLDETEFSVFEMNFKIPGGSHETGLVLAFPSVSLSPEKTSNQWHDCDWSARLEKTVCSARMDLRVAAHHVQIPYEAVESLAVGQVMVLPESPFDNVSLVKSGSIIARGRLGQLNGMRALKVSKLGAGDGMIIRDQNCVSVKPEAEPSDTLAPLAEV